MATNEDEVGFQMNGYSKPLPKMIVGDLLQYLETPRTTIQTNHRAT